MDFESEVISRNFLPAARTLLAEKLQDDYGLYQEEIAEEMEVTQPAVSKYLNKNRANEELLEKFKDDPQIMLLVEDAASKAAKGDNYTNEFRQILEAVKSKGLMSQKFKGTEKL